MTTRSDFFFDQSQSLFPDSQKFCNDIGPTPPPLFTQDNTQGNKKRLFNPPRKFQDENILPRSPPYIERNTKKFVPSEVHKAFLKTCIPPSPSVLSQKYQFSAPFSQNPADNQAENKKSKQFPLPLVPEALSRVENFVSKHRSVPVPTQSQRSSINSQRKSWQPPKATPIQMKSPTPKKSTLNVVPETPFTINENIAASTESLNFDILDESDEEGQGAIFGPSLRTPAPVQLPPIRTPGGHMKDGVKLRTIEEIPDKYRSVFSTIPCFNVVQSKVFDDALYTNKALVVCAPTGSGKTVIFELAIIAMLINSPANPQGKRKTGGSVSKVVYMAPIKALCTERYEDWSKKFSPLGLECQELTGDSDVDDYWQLQKADIILTTPEKWDSMTRRWRDNTSLVRRVHLFLIDEVHLLNDETRGATMEAVVSRMKTVQSCIKSDDSGLRFVAVSATIPNTDDIAEWLGSANQPALSFDMDESYRPVKLRKVVLGYPWSSNGSEFKFDINLNYKLGNVIHTYSEGKPTLVFCSTRKSVEQAASTLAKDLNFVLDATHKQTLTKVANIVRNTRLREMLVGGIGYHHAGLDAHDRHLVEETFLAGDLLVLVSTSTLAMGVNLPAHLVVVKSTCHYVKGTFQEYSQSEILQMTGRAGRPQFDETATAVIMTREQSRSLYQNIVNGSQKIESSLHSHLIEHLNAEIVLLTICDVSVALEWIRSTFLYIRLLKNPTHYGYPEGLSKEEADTRLHELCTHNLSQLQSFNLISIDKDQRLIPNEPGRLMARYCLTFDTVKKFGSLTGNESLQEMVDVIAGCREFQEVNLRMNERTTLNKMNKDKNRVVIRFPMTGRIKTTQMKVNCLLQATMGCINIQDFALSQDVTRIFRNAVRVARCLVELLMLKDNFKSLYNATLLSKCIRARLWENSRYVTKQLTNIGATLSSALANAGVATFSRAHEMNPRELELIVNRHAPFGNHMHDAIKHLPKYEVQVEQSKKYSSSECGITVQVLLKNAADLLEKSTTGKKHCCLLLIGDADNHTILKQRISDSLLTSTPQNMWQRSVNITRAAKGDELSVKLISFEWVGLDVESTYTPYYVGPKRMIATSSTVANDGTQSQYFDKKKKPCRHQCSNKRTCAHECCKVGLEATTNRGSGVVESHASFIKKRINTPIKQPPQGYQPNVEHLKRFKFDRKSHAAPASSQQCNQVVPSTPSSNPGWKHLDFYCKTQETEGQPIQLQNQPIQQQNQPIQPQNQPIQQDYSPYQPFNKQFQQPIDQFHKDQHNTQQSNQQNQPRNHQLQHEYQHFQSKNQRLASEFQREQDSYEDQINLGGRMRYNDDDDIPSLRKRPVQLWTEKGDSQEFAEQTPKRNYTFGHSKMKSFDQRLANEEMAGDECGVDSSTSRMGRVVAWKSNTGQRSSMFHPPSYPIPTPKRTPSNPRNELRRVSPLNVSAGKPAKRMVFNQRTNTYTPCTPQQLSTQTTTDTRSSNGNFQPRLNEQDSLYGSKCGDKTQERPNTNIGMEGNVKKKVTFSSSNQSIPISPLVHDVSIDCDFELTVEEEDDLMLLEACERAESIHPSHLMLDADHSMKMGDGEYGGGGQMQLSEELDEVGSWSPIPVDAEQDPIPTNQDQPPIILTGSPDVEEHGCSILALSAPPPTSQLWTSNLTPSQPANKLNDLHDARKMFDSIFDGIF